MWRRCLGLALLSLTLALDALAAQTTGTLHVLVTSDGAPLAGAVISAAGTETHTDTEGSAALTLPLGVHEVAIGADLHASRIVIAVVPSDRVASLRVDLEPRLEVEEEIFVTATRTDTRLQDQPVRVEVIDREEIEEKALMTPGSVAMLLGETTGLRVQTTSPSLGGGNVRIQGLRGRYAQVVADGLPLYGGQADSFSLFQVPPLDLGQVEVIKGVASALYGASALGGVINLVSRRPREDETQLLVNMTSQLGRDVTTWLARAPNAAGWAWSLLGGYHGQTVRDLDGDGWSDVPAFERGVVRPRLFFDNRRGTTLLATSGVTIEDRRGGTLSGRVAPDGVPFEEALASRRLDGGVLFSRLMSRGWVLSARASAMRFAQRRRFGEAIEGGTRSTWFGEASVQGSRGRHTWVLGGAFQQDRYRPRELSALRYTFSTPSVFLQDELALTQPLTLAISARVDAHSEYGALITPRVSLLVKPREGWTMRTSAGLGAFAPTPFTEETELTGLARVRPLLGVRAERAQGGSLDVTRASGGFEVTATLFGSIVRHPLQGRDAGGATTLVNAGGPTRSWGTELLGRYRVGEVVVLATHAWTRSTEDDPDQRGRREVPLTPAHTASLNVMWESVRKGRFGLEAYFIGRQPLEDNPYTSTGRSQFLLGALVERVVGKARLFLNSENVLNVRQTRQQPLVLPTRAADGRWTVDAWAPLDGRVFNGGIRLAF